MRPSDVVLGFPPLPATMGRAELEYAAALLVRALTVLGDEWRPVAWFEVQEVLKADIDAKREPVFSLLLNPFFRPDLAGLCASKFARWVGEPGRKDTPIEFTDEGLKAMGRWVWPAPAPAAEPGGAS